MGAEYTRQSTFGNGDVIDAGLFNAEFDQLVAAFNEATGHDHSGSGNGAPIAGTVVSFDNTSSGLTAEDIQAAVDEIEARLEIEEGLTNTGPVMSVNGDTGIVVITSASLSLGNVDNTSDVNKPVSDDTQTALDLKADATAVTAGLALKAAIAPTVTDHGSVASGTVTLDFDVTRKHKITVTGSITVALSNPPTSGTEGEYQLELVNGGGFVVNLPVTNWYLGDGLTSLVFDDMGIALNPAGTNTIVWWADDGNTTVYGVAA